MARFKYLEDDAAGKKAAKKARKLEAAAGKAKKKNESRRAAAEARDQGQVEVVYVRRETIRATWRELKADGGESLSELVDDLLLRWLQERQEERGELSAADADDSGEDDFEGRDDD